MIGGIDALLFTNTLNASPKFGYFKHDMYFNGINVQ